jgi:preprotein translocase SecE subunit
MGNIFSFLGEVRAELQKIVWPKWDEFVGMVTAVCIVVAFFAVVLGTMDFSFSFLLKQVLS